MRDPKTGREAMDRFISALKKSHDEYVHICGYGLEERLTGLHETCDMKTFRSGVADRGASIRIPGPVDKLGYGYIEDRRPGANADPYELAEKLLEGALKK